MDIINTALQQTGLGVQLSWLSLGLSLGGVLLVGKLVFYLVASRKESYDRKEENDIKRLQKKEACAQSIKDLETRLEDDPLKEDEVKRITGLSLTDLIKELKDGEITPSTALKAYQTKAIEIHKETNCLIEVITEAETWAEEVAKTPNDGLLWGVPISLKEDFVIKGYDSTLGCIEWAGHPATKDCLLLKVLKSHGAIPYVRTNVPQLCHSYEPGNPIFGLVQNPVKIGHGPGGSSSGESALIAGGGSILGIGSDIGGSIRIPAHFTGITGFKPTVGRMSNYGVDEGTEQSEVDYIYGPLARDVEDLVLTMRLFYDGKSLSTVDPTSLPIPFNEEVYKSTQPLKIGYYVEGTGFPVFEPCKRAVRDAKTILEKQGHEVVSWDCPDLNEAYDQLFRFMNAEGGVYLSPLLRYDIVDDTIKSLVSDKLTPFWLRWIQAKLAKIFKPDLAEKFEESLGTQKTLEYWYYIHVLKMFAAKVTQSWAEAGLDAVICPPASVVAPRFGNPEPLLTWTVYSSLYNTVNFPCGIVPMTKVNASDIDSLKDFPTDTDMNKKLKEEMAYCLGLPAGVMVVAPRFKDEVSLRLMTEIQNNKST